MDNMENLCRICLKECPKLKSVFHLEENIIITEIIAKILPMINFNNSQFSQKVCAECLVTLVSAYKLIETSNNTEKALSSMLEESIEIKVEPKKEWEQSDDTEVFLDDVDEIVDDDDDDDKLYEPEINLEPEIEIDETTPKKPKRPKAHICPICFKAFEKPSKLLRHSVVHDESRKPFACEVPNCHQRFVTEGSLIRHGIMHSDLVEKAEPTNPDKKHICVVCKKEFPNQESLASHFKIHKEESLEFPCTLCSKVFFKLNQLTRHSRTHPENKTHKCNICHKLFAQGSHLIDHLNRHKGVRPHVCTVCNKAFQQSSTLKDHMRTHSDEKPFLCSQCGKSFNNASNLRQHVKRHLDVKPFSCNLCPGRFSCKGKEYICPRMLPYKMLLFIASLDSHLQSHTGVKPHVCPICGSSFSKQCSLRKHHRTIHENLREHECDVCAMKVR